MIGILDNAKHQLTVAGTGMLAEARAGQVDATGYQLLDVPVVEINADGSLTLRIVAVDEPQKRPHKSRNVASEKKPAFDGVEKWAQSDGVLSADVFNQDDAND